VKAFRRLDTYDRALRLSSWLFRIAHNTLIDHVRRRQVRAIPLDEPQTGSELAEALVDPRAESPDRAVEREVQRWIEAEWNDRTEEAEEALRLAFRSVPHRAPRPGFADRALLAAAPVAAARRPQVFGAWWFKAATSAGLALAALAAAALNPAAAVASSSSALVDVAVGASVWLARCLQTGVAVWTALEAAGRLTGLVISTRPVAAALAADVLLSVVLLYVLKRLLVSPSEPLPC